MAKIKVDGYNDYAGYFPPEMEVLNEDGLYETVPYDPELHEIDHIVNNPATIYPGDPRMKDVPRYASYE